MKLNPSHTFISTPDSSYSYSDLIGFSKELQQRYERAVSDSTSPQVLVLADKNISSAFIISACFLNQIPMVILPIDSDKARIRKTINETNVVARFSSNLDFESDDNLQVIDIPDIKSNGESHSFPDLHSFNYEKLFAILFTSGTTSEAKAVPLKFKHVLSAAENSFKNLPLDSNDEWLLNLPLHHIGGISVLIRSILAGSKVFQNPINSTTELGKVFLNRHSITYASLVPTQLKRLLDDPDFNVGPNFKAILLGGGPIPASVHRLAIKRSIPVVPSFGMTETAAQCIAVPFDTWYNAPEGTSGKPLDSVQLSLRQDSSGQSNLLWIKGTQVFEGYLDETLNESSFDSDGWFNTGDYAHIDENEFVFIEMRRSDRIVSGGENINPFYVEDILETHELVAEAGVYGLPDEEWGQIVCAALVLKDNSSNMSLNELTVFLKSRLQGFMIPKKIILVEKLPRTASGKLIRSELINLS